MSQKKEERLSIYLSNLLRHAPQDAGLDMDLHGWVFVEQLIQGINATGKYRIDLERLKAIVATDDKGRFRISEDGQKIKACQGHSISWVQPELEIMPPPPVYITEQIQRLLRRLWPLVRFLRCRAMLFTCKQK